MTFIEYLAVLAIGLLLTYVVIDFVMCLSQESTGSTGQDLVIGAVCGLCAAFIFIGAYITIAVVVTGGPAILGVLGVIKHLMTENGCKKALEYLRSDLPDLRPSTALSCVAVPDGSSPLRPAQPWSFGTLPSFE